MTRKVRLSVMITVDLNPNKFDRDEIERVKALPTRGLVNEALVPYILFPGTGGETVTYEVVSDELEP